MQVTPKQIKEPTADLADINATVPKLRRVVVMAKQNSSIFDPTVLDCKEPGEENILNSLLPKKNNSCE